MIRMRIMRTLGKAATGIARGIVKARGGDATGRSAMAGYTRGTDAAPSSPVSLDEFERLKRAVLFTDDDIGYLRMSRGVLEDQVEDVLDAWYGFVGSHPFLLYYFTNRDTGLPEPEYLVKTRERFGRWILDTADANYDQTWLDYQYEIGLRHHRSRKNRTDGSQAVEHINYRYLPPLHIPDHRDPQALPRAQGPRCRRGGENAPGLAEVRDPAGDAVEPALREGRRLLGLGAGIPPGVCRRGGRRRGRHA